MILLVDGGSTKTDWCLTEAGRQIARTLTQGANPLFHTVMDLQAEWKATVVPLSEGYSIETIYFYGAGCFSEKTKNVVQAALKECWPDTIIKIESDLLGAARGLCGHEAGIACILGTGSNTCAYDGQKICKRILPLGYILGDEGSGSALGKLLIGACLRDQLTPELKEKFFDHFGLTTETILHKVYRDSMPNQFLASLSPFLLYHLSDVTVYTLVRDAFRDFFLKTVHHYDYSHLSVHFTGSIAFHYSTVLQEVASSLYIPIASICPSPMEGLIRFHSSL
ncbi:MAG: ATPase [Tannerellaceae bacterium]|jgi:N-acetylglucosamine kinase-like BadF-type ATPase|nr:ATPase [Tannerellaceae bacterium]